MRPRPRCQRWAGCPVCVCGGGEARRKGVGGSWVVVVAEEDEATTKRRARAGERRRRSCGVAGRIALMDVDRRSCGVGAEDVPSSGERSVFEVKAAGKGPVSGEGVEVGMLEGKVDSNSYSTVVWPRAGCSLKLDRDRGQHRATETNRRKGQIDKGVEHVLAAVLDVRREDLGGTPMLYRGCAEDKDGSLRIDEALVE